MALYTGGPKNFVPLREDPSTEDGLDGKRLEYFRSGWSKTDDLYRHFERQVEENVRMLAGQQYSVYHPVLGQWLDLIDLMTDKEQVYRPRPVFNRILPWYIVTHARMTENPPILTFEPGPDRIDAELAETMDTAQKVLWREIGMVDKIDLLCGWIIVGGRAHMMSRIDPNKGPMKKWIGQAELPIVDQYGEPVMEEGQDGAMVPSVTDPMNDIPHDQQGQPLARMTPDGVQVLGEPHEEPEGKLIVDVYSPLQVRGSWGPAPWHEKRVHRVKTFLTPEEVWELSGVEVEPDTRGGSTSDAGELERILFGTGFYGAAESRIGSELSGHSTEGYCEVLTTWEAPCPYGGLEETGESAGGRVNICTQKKVLLDAVRPAKLPHTSPLRTFEFIRMPGRPNAGTPQEAMNGPQRTYNEGYRRIQAHTNLMSDPVTLVDKQSGINPDNWVAEPGVAYETNMRPGVDAVKFISPQSLGQDVYKLQEMVLNELTDIGNLHGTQGETPTPDASGELVKELRFNSDRFLGPTMRRMVEELGRLVEDWQQLLPLIWDEQKVLTYAGEDNVARTITVMPYMFQQGKINITPDVESMLPEGRGDRQARVYKMYLDGLLGLPGSPEALKRFYELAHFPHLSRIGKPGGVDRTTAEQENGQLAQGTDPRMIPVYEWYDHTVHLAILEEHMKSPEFKKHPDQIKAGFVYHRQAHMMFQQQQMLRAAQQQAALTSIANPQPMGGGAPPGKGAPGDTNLNPKPPTPPTGGAPGGRMPTAQLSTATS